MNSILMIVIAVVILLLVFVMFSLDDHEEEKEGFLDEVKAPDAIGVDIATVAVDSEVESEIVSEPPAEKQSNQIVAGERVYARPVSKIELPEKLPLVESGSEDDLRLRIQLDERLPLPVSFEESNAVVAAVQLRFPEEVLADTDGFFKLLVRAESVFGREFSFNFSSYSASQLDRLWLFGRDEGRDDPLFEALVVAFEVISRFKKTLENDDVLRASRVRVAVGLSMGKLLKINRGIATVPGWLGKPAYLAETLAEAAGDFCIYVDDEIHKSALPLFDFREWKPTKLRSLPAIPFFELVGWNKPDEIAAFANHKEVYARRAVAIAYRYLDLDDKLQPLIELLSDPDEKVAIEALETVKVIGSEHSLGLLKRIFPETQDPVFRSAIIDAFASIGRNEVVPVILGSTKEANWKVRFSASKALYKLAGKDSLRHLEHLLGDPDGAVKACVNGIFFRETAQKEYAQALAELVTDLSKRTRKAAADELLAIESETTLKVVVNAFADQELELQKHILRKLECSKSKILYQCFLTIFKNSGEKIRPFIIEAVRRAGIVS
ncbi:MAG: HEAT repeat domain-containing protein [Candidatus Riflebacteria bacterium]|nr:HEAT repeat domain-containing protein [Candidatus Riflebacteria bacterium]